MTTITITYDYLQAHFKGLPDCIEYTTAIAEALNYKIVAKPRPEYLQLDFYNNFISQKTKEIK